MSLFEFDCWLKFGNRLARFPVVAVATDVVVMKLSEMPRYTFAGFRLHIHICKHINVCAQAYNTYAYPNTCMFLQICTYTYIL